MVKTALVWYHLGQQSEAVKSPGIGKWNKEQLLSGLMTENFAT